MPAARGQALQRLKQEYVRLCKEPLPYICATPLPSNILEWHYVISGPEGTPYCGGMYHGKLVFPADYPFKPPAIYMMTPNGRFKPNTRLCLSISDFHPETWNPAWCVGTILTGLLSFFTDTTATLGSVETTKVQKKQLARDSLQHNLNNARFRELFPDMAEEMEAELVERDNAAAASPPPAAVVSLPTDTPNWSSLGWNALFIVSLGLFGLIVKRVMNSETAEL